MKQLLVTRHAKSSWNTNASDFMRPLNKRGIRDAPVMAQRLQQRGSAPELILSSTAYRALETAELIRKEMSLEQEQLLTTDSIYEAPLDALRQATTTLPDNATVVMLVGHNPGVSRLCQFLCRQTNLQMPTCAIACFNLDIDRWQDTYRDCATLLWYDYPKNGQQAHQL